MDKKHYDIGRIVRNAETLSDPQMYECFIYDCEDPKGFADVESEIEEIENLLPEGIGILDLPKLFSGNKHTKIFGKATCSSTIGHQILLGNNTNRVLFHSENEALKSGFRPCAKCMPEQYEKWKKHLDNSELDNE